MEWAIHATVAAHGLKEEHLPQIFGRQRDFFHFDLGEGLKGGVEVPSPGLLEVYTRTSDPCRAMSLLVSICQRLRERGFRVSRLSVEAIPLG